MIEPEILTLYAADVTYKMETQSYQNEFFLIEEPYRKDISTAVTEYMEEEKYPENLKYVSSYHNLETDTSATLFEDTNTGKLILAYTGTNPQGRFAKDVATNIVDIGLGYGALYSAALEMHDKVRQEYPDKEMLITGHSQGGAIAQFVAVVRNAPKTITYDPAPIYVLSRRVAGKLTFLDVTGKYFAMYNMAEIEKNFTGEIINIRSKNDWLTSMGVVGKYYGNMYTLDSDAGHSLLELRKEDTLRQLKDLLITGNRYYIENGVYYSKYNSKLLEKLFRGPAWEELSQEDYEKLDSYERITYDMQHNFENTFSKLVELEGLKERLQKSDGLISTSEAIYLDANEVLIAVTSAKELAASCITELIQDCTGAITELDKIWSDTMDIARQQGSGLDDKDFSQTLTSNGLTYENLIQPLITKINDKIEKGNSINKAYSELMTRIEKTIQEIVNKDISLAKQIMGIDDVQTIGMDDVQISQMNQVLNLTRVQQNSIFP